MYTQCPECGTVFRVTAPVLRAAQGQVRCGVCDASFDALRFLTDDVELEVNAASASRIVGAPAETRAPPPPPPPPPPRNAPQPPAPPRSAPPARELGAATRNRPSADEERELGEIAAILARGGQPRGSATAAPTAAPAAPPTATRAAAPVPKPGPAAGTATAPAAPAADDGEVNILEPADVEDIVIGDDAGEHISDAALEFDLPADSWEQVFVRDPAAARAAPLDLDLAGDRPAAGDARFEAPDELMILEIADDPLARTDEYRVPDFAAELELEPQQVSELAPAEFAELEHRPGAAAPAARASAAPREAAPAWTPVPVEPGAAAEFEPAGGHAGRGRTSGPRRLAAAAAAVLLALGLAVQVVHHYRDALAESSLSGPALAALYARLGVPLEPRWNLGAYDVRQWGAQSEEIAGVLRLRASIVNRATRAQPFPLLRVTLEDRFGSQVGRREFTPAEYLPGRTAPRELLGAGARADADLSLADPGNLAVGFELDVCLPRHGALYCGADAKAGGG